MGSLFHLNYSRLIRLFSVSFLILLLTITSTVSAGSIADTIAGACVSTGTGNKYITFLSYGTTTTCSQACASGLPLTTEDYAHRHPTCIKAWGVWTDKSFGYASDACDTVIVNTTTNFQGLLCCCDSSYYPLPVQDPKHLFSY